MLPISSSNAIKSGFQVISPDKSHTQRSTPDDVGVEYWHQATRIFESQRGCAGTLMVRGPGDWLTAMLAIGAVDVCGSVTGASICTA